MARRPRRCARRAAGGPARGDATPHRGRPLLRPARRRARHLPRRGARARPPRARRPTRPLHGDDPMTLSPRLAALGEDLHRAAHADLASARSRRRRRRVGAVLAVAVAVPGAAVAADRLISTHDVARSLPAGTLSLAGT